MIGDHLDSLTFEALISEALAEVSSKVDKRQGSIIWDTLAAWDVQLAQAYIKLKGSYLDTYALTAEGEYLDYKAAEAGIFRATASTAVKLGVFLDSEGNPATVPMAARFSTTSDSNALIYYVSAAYSEDGTTVPGYYQMTCETPGEAGNNYTGKLLAVTNIAGVSSAEMSELLVAGSDQETDDSLRARYISRVNYPPYGGNVADYVEWILAIDGVGAVQVYPVWAGGGTVKCSIVGSDWLPASDTLIGNVQNEIDPPDYQGLGYGKAPIGATVTIVTPDELAIDITADLTLENGVTLAQVAPDCEAAAAEYLLSIRKSFGSVSKAGTYYQNVYRSQINSALLAVDGVLNVTNITINGADTDLTLEQSATEQFLPVPGTVVLG